MCFGRKILGSLSLSVFLLTPLAGVQASDQQVSQYLVSQKAEQLSLLERLVNIDSDTLNIEGVLKPNWTARRIYPMAMRRTISS